MRFGFCRMTGFEVRDAQMIVQYRMVRRLGRRLLNDAQRLIPMTQLEMDPPERIEKVRIRRGCFKRFREHKRTLQTLRIALLIGQQRRQIIRGNEGPWTRKSALLKGKFFSSC